MSFAICRMQKMKSHDLKGIQFHNQRERESKTNSDIDKERSHKNYDFVNDENIDYNERVKEIIESQKTGSRKTRKDAVLVNELLVTSDRDFFERLDPVEQKRFFEESFKLFSERYGEQNIAYATVHNDEKTPHLHIGVVPMRDGKLQGKNVFNRAELLWMQDKFPEHMQKLGFDLERGEKGSDRQHIETTKYKKQTLEKEIDFLEKNIVTKKDELTAFIGKVESDLTVPAKRQTKNVEVPTGEKNLFGKEKTKTVKKPTENVIISRTDYKKLVAAAQDNEKLKIHLKQVLNTDMAKENRELRENYEVLRGKHNDLVHRFNGMVEDHNELVQENKSLKARVSDLKREIGFVYKSAKDFLEERIRGLSAFRSAFKDLVDKVKEKTPGSEFERLHKRERRLEQNREMER
ncbi:plasmid recombination protein [Listeria monocytogenes]|uniref:Plasmid recombination protein n=9 Tax=Bacteria TaxID=2 RepID=A0ABX0WFC8_9RHOB|nr:MobV family relaxase [Listeria monocytogenes]EAA5296928.1 plasmid recombination protein [Salmonella enterica subsp. enterica serovar Enteritidis]MBC9708766.1 plasmid recombination protein [Enterococcus sp.]NIZ63499.1 plasmid recombination protein [Sedimentitalea sp. CY04]HDR4624142.1 plasmid recombination protein [Bacillus cereus]HEA7200812.1 plasmid recombination protein [Escherichia coli]